MHYMKNSEVKIKDTALGGWLKDKAPGILSTVGDLLPDQGALGVVKNLLDKEPGVDPAEAKAKIEAEIAFQNNVTERWKADMSSDVNLAKYIRPVTLICLMVMFMALPQDARTRRIIFTIQWLILQRYSLPDGRLSAFVRRRY